MLRANCIFWTLAVCLVTGTPAVAQEGVRLEVDKEASRIVAHADATGHRFDVVVTEYELDLHWDPEEKTVRAARLVFDFADVETGRDRRDREMREWLEYGSFPEAEFVLEGFETEDGELVAKGTFSLHGVEQEISFPVTVEEDGDEVRIRAETTLDHRDWDLEKIRAFLLMTVDPVLEVEIDVKAAIP